jgi:hypothetical protein
MKVLPTMGSMYSGSLRGITAAHNAGGLYFRGRTVPTNPNTARQQDMRSIVGGLTQSWSSTLTEAQRQAWRDYAANVPVVDRLGETMTLSGINWFIKSRASAFQVTNSTLSATASIGGFNAPTTFNTGESVLSVDTFEGDFTTPPGTLDIAGTFNGVAPTDGVVAVFIAPPQTAGTRYYKGPYQLATVVDFVATDFAWTRSGIDLSDATEWIADTVPVAGWDTLYVPLKLVVLYDDGRRAQDFRMLIQFTDATP